MVDDRREHGDERRESVRRLEDRTTADHDLLVSLCADVRHVEEKVELLVTRLEFAPVKLVTYGIVGVILSGVIAALLALVISVQVR